MLLALISSTFLFMVLYYVGEEWLDYYFNSSSYMVNMQKPYLESLQQYIKKNGITTKEYKKLNPWIQKNNSLFRIVCFLTQQYKYTFHKSSMQCKN